MKCSMAPEKHLQYFENVLKLLNNAGMEVELKRCSRIIEVIAYSGHIMAPSKL